MRRIRGYSWDSFFFTHPSGAVGKTASNQSLRAEEPLCGFGTRPLRETKLQSQVRRQSHFDLGEKHVAVLG
jgi:hypothetical protein